MGLPLLLQHPWLTLVVQGSIEVVAPCVEASGVLDQVSCPCVPSSREA